MKKLGWEQAAKDYKACSETGHEKRHIFGQYVHIVRACACGVMSTVIASPRCCARARQLGAATVRHPRAGDRRLLPRRRHCPATDGRA